MRQPRTAYIPAACPSLPSTNVVIPRHIPSLLMTTRTATFIDYANVNSPGSEKSIYFDAPTMIFSKKKSADTAPTESTEPQVSSPSRFEEHLPGAFSADEDAPVAHDGASVTRKPSVGIARDPVIRKIPSDRDEEASAEADQEDSAEDGADLSHNKSKSSHRRSQSVAITSDSGYDSTSNGNRNPKRSQSRASQRSMQAIPVVWTDSPRARNQRSLEDGDDEDEGEERRIRDSNFRRAASLRSFRSGPRGSKADLEDRGSIRTTPSMDAGRRSALRRRRASLSNGSFASGPGTVGPAASADLDGAFQTRSRSAELSLTEKQKLKLSKSQSKHVRSCEQKASI